MSTPTTATAPLPHYTSGYPFAHQPSYRPALSAQSSRLGPSSLASASTSTSSSASTNGSLLLTTPVLNSTSAISNHSRSVYSQSHHHHNHQSHHSPLSHHNSDLNNHHNNYNQDALISPSYTTAQHPPRPVPEATSIAKSEASFSAGISPFATMDAGSQPPRKRRRSGPPDWDSFYKNGLPQEVIVIEDSPETDNKPHPGVISAYASVDSASVAGLNNTSNSGNGGNGSNGSSATSSSGTIYPYSQQNASTASDAHLAKKRRRTDQALPAGGTQYDPVHNPNYAPSGGSTISSERTNSNSNSSLYASTTLNTAATSLTSTNGDYDYDAATAGQKRKRATRQQIAIESKKRDRDAAAAAAAVVGHAYTTYHPPPLPPIKAPEVEVKVIHDSNHNKNNKVDDEEGHYIVVPDADLTDRYQMIKLLGQGTFGKVVQAHDRYKKEFVAIKIIRSVQKYRDASRIELRVLETLKANDRENRNRCIHLRECFDYRGHICIVMDLLGQSVFDFLKGNGFVPFPNSHIQSFARQLFTSVAYLKPENILLVDTNYQTFTYNRKIPSSSTTVARQATQRKVLLDTKIRLIDFGSATFQDEYHSSVVSTRHYRAPEIILGLGWSYPCDIWSIGCILVEFFTGDALFQTHDNLEHLAMMEAVCGSRIDAHLIQQVAKSTRHGGNPAAKYFKRSKLDYPNSETSRASKRFVKAMKKLNDIIPSTNNFLKLFLDLLRRIFVYEPSQRITAKEALRHPWFQEVALQDDGTEAAKIRQERARVSRERAAARMSQIHTS